MMAQKLSFLLLLLLLTPFSSEAQNWRKNAKEADDLYSKGLYLEAADLYQAAWAQKPKKTDLAYKAGEAYMLNKSYSNAASAYSQTLDKAKSYPLVGLKYARAQKQAGEYAEASRAFSSFIGTYKGNDLDQMSQIVENEIRGCELGLKIQNDPSPKGVQVVHLNSNINTPYTEFAPIPYNEEILYFSSTSEGRAQIYRSQYDQGEWGPASLSTSFPEIEKDHFCNGTLTPDNKRFYFTICTTAEKKGQFVTRCAIYVTKRQGNTWSLPERLRDYVNLEDATTTQPFVIFNGTTEILYFSSDRPGGYGGLDIWYITRDINSKDFDFTYPVNCGPVVNTSMDEITPYYDLEEAALYFSSTGHISIGGYDVQKASGSRSQWKDVENLGAPFNSSADDYYFIRSPSKRMGFFVSNRSPGQGSATNNEDIFQFFYELGNLSEDYPTVSGYVYDKLTGEVLSDVEVEVAEITEKGDRFQVGKERFADGNYSFSLLNDRTYEITARKDGFKPSTISLQTTRPRPSEKGFSNPIFLNNISRPMPPPPPREVEKTPPPVETPPPPPVAFQPTAYRLQVSAVKNFQPERFSALEDIGQIQTEEIPGRGLIRVMVGDFSSLEEARQAQGNATKKGFKGSIIVLYENGERIRTLD
ncbi:MAG: carboxypeptidase regulatory-like domain-containing protein [Lewinellaceae bacterium]|nr:carboxypeptidase regulatory-like domain-containing protein [Lewinellaceae bacterium]